MRVFVTKTKTSAGHYRYEYIAEAPAAGTIWVESHYDDPDEGIRNCLRQNFTEVVIVEQGFPS